SIMRSNQLPTSPPPFSFLFSAPPPPRPTLFPYTTLFRSAGKRPLGPWTARHQRTDGQRPAGRGPRRRRAGRPAAGGHRQRAVHRSEEHTSELQSLRHLVCRLLLEKKKK